MSTDPLPSWNEGPTKAALLGFLDASSDVPVADRVAVFDNDGTLWCEKPNYVQLVFMLDQLARAVDADPALAERMEFRALLDHDHAAQAELGLERIAAALVQLCAGIEPGDFDTRVLQFFAAELHAERRVPYRFLRYRPMLELIAALRTASFSVFVVTGGGTEFVRAISHDFYGVGPEGVVGTLVDYDYSLDDAGRPRLLRTSEMIGSANEGAAKVSNIQRELGRRPIFAAGNTVGDREMLDYALGADGPTMAVLVEHDDAAREYAYAGQAGTIDFDGDILDLAQQSGWTVARMRTDWNRVFADR